MIIRDFNFETDYTEIASWWKKQDWTVLSKEMLSGSGFIVETEKEKLAATWIFKTNSPIYLMEWTIGNPDASWEERAKAIDLVTDAACDWAKNNGAKYVMTMTKNKRFLEKLEKNKFIKTDIDMTHLVRSL